MITLSSCVEAAIIIDGGDEDEPPPFSTSAPVSKNVWPQPEITQAHAGTFRLESPKKRCKLQVE